MYMQKKHWFLAGYISLIWSLFIELPISVSKYPVVMAQTSDNSVELPFSPTTIEQLRDFLQKKADNLRVENGQLRFDFSGVPMIMMADIKRDRMRIVAPIAEVSQLDSQELEKMLVANFHTTLDGRYTISNGIVFAAFIHPLSSLPERDFYSALYQVSQLVKNFGTTYSSGGLLFTPGASNPPKTQPQDSLEI